MSTIAIPSSAELMRRLKSLPADQRTQLDEFLRMAVPAIWVPQAGPQSVAFHSLADIIFYGGSAGGGKTDLLLGLCLTQHEHSIIFRREAVQLVGIEERMTKILGSRDGYNSQDGIWRLPEGRVMELGSVKEPGDWIKYQGRPHDLKAFDEICHFTEGQFRALIGWMRTDNPNVRQRVVCAGNPPTDATGEWVKRYWAPWLDPNHPNPAKPGELRWFITNEKGEDQEVPGPEPVMVGEDLVQPKSRTFIPSRVDDNLFLMATGYKAQLQALPEPLRSQMLRGDFNAGAADPVWQLIPTEWVKAAQDFLVGLGLNVHPVVGSEASSLMDKAGQLHFRNKRAEMYWRLREALDPTATDPIALPPDSELLGDLTAPRYKVVTMGKGAAIQISSKDDIRDVLGRSPDKGDSVSFDNNIQGEIVVSDLDPMDVIPDPDAKAYDPDKWGDVLITRWLTLDEIGQLYGQKARKAAEESNDAGADFGELDDEEVRSKFASRDNTGAFDACLKKEDGQQRYRIIDRQRFIYELTPCIVWPVTGDVRTEADLAQDSIADAIAQGAVRAKRMRRRVKWTVTTLTATLFDGYSPYEHFTVVPYFAYFRRGKTGGMVDDAIGPQEALNKAISQYVHVVTLAIAPRFAPPYGVRQEGGASGDMRIQRANERGAAHSLQQPPLPQAGMGNRATPVQVDTSKLSDEEYMALPEAERKKARGD